MTSAVLLGVLAVFDCVLAGFRAAAGRNGRLDKRAYYRAAMVRAFLAGVLLVGVHVVLALALMATSPSPSATWGAFTSAATRLVVVYGAFATATLAAFAFYFAPIGDFRVLTSVIVFGPLTLARPLVIVGGLAAAALLASDPRVVVLAASAGVSMIGLEHVLGRSYGRHWRRLVRDSA